MAYANDLYNKYINNMIIFNLKKSPRKNLSLQRSLSNISEYGSSYHSARSNFSDSSNKGGMSKNRKIKKIKKSKKSKKNQKNQKTKTFGLNKKVHILLK